MRPRDDGKCDYSVYPSTIGSPIAQVWNGWKPCLRLTCGFPYEIASFKSKVPCTPIAA